MSVDSVKQKNISKTLTLWNFFTIGFGAIIGTGWIFLVGEWIIISGGPIPAMLAFLLGALLLLPIGAVFGELTSALLSPPFLEPCSEICFHGCVQSGSTAF